MERKTKKMVATEAEIAGKRGEIGVHRQKIQELNSYKPSLEPGQKAKEDAIKELDNQCNTLAADIKKLHEQLEVQTVDMFAGKDTDFAEPTPTEALRDAG